MYWCKAASSSSLCNISSAGIEIPPSLTMGGAGGGASSSAT